MPRLPVLVFGGATAGGGAAGSTSDVARGESWAKVRSERGKTILKSSIFAKERYKHPEMHTV